MGTARLWWGTDGPHARGLGHTQRRAVGQALTYIAHIDGTLVNLHLLLGCQREESCGEGKFVMDTGTSACSQYRQP